MRRFLIALALWACGSAAQAGVFNPETFTLANGLTVVVIANHRAPVVSHMVWYKVGAADEPPGKSGLAHFLEHLMFKATAHRPAGEFSKTVARNGGDENAFTSSDYTAYYQNIAVDRLELVMSMEADRMTGLTLDGPEIDTERQVILEERRMRTGNNPGARMREQLEAALFLNHPYGKPVIGWEHEIKALDRAEIVDFYRRWYAPNNAILVVAGDITAATLRPMVERTYGKVPAHGVPERARPQEPPAEADRLVVMRDPRVTQPGWSRLFLAPSARRGDSRYTDALDVLEQILGGPTGRLYRSLVIAQELAVSAGVHYSPQAFDLAVFEFQAIPRPRVGLDRLEAAMQREIDELLTKGVTYDEVAQAKKRLAADAIYARDNPATAARVFGAALAIGQSIDDVENWPDRLAAVSVAEVNAAARQVLGGTVSVIGHLLPKEAGR